MNARTLVIVAVLLFFCPPLGAQSPVEHYEKGLAGIRKGEFEGALRHFNTCLDSTPGHLNARYRRAFVYTALERHEEALGDYNYLIDKGVDQANLYYSRGTSYYYLEDYEKAIADFNLALEMTEDERLMQEIFNNRGWARMKSGDSYGACKDWERSEEMGNEEAERFLDDYSNECD
jgi:tetratricopeptide (TPR) repeat protein